MLLSNIEGIISYFKKYRDESSLLVWIQQRQQKRNFFDE